jgi:hypothetical protein
MRGKFGVLRQARNGAKGKISAVVRAQTDSRAQSAAEDARDLSCQKIGSWRVEYAQNTPKATACAAKARNRRKFDNSRGLRFGTIEKAERQCYIETVIIFVRRTGLCLISNLRQLRPARHHLRLPLSAAMPFWSWF